MGYLFYHDYVKAIEPKNLEQILDRKQSIRLEAELAAVEKAKSYLVQKFNVSEEFTNVADFDFNTSYNAGITVQLEGKPWYSGATYNQNDIIIYPFGGSYAPSHFEKTFGVYYALSANTDTAPATTGTTWQLLGNQYDIWHTNIPQLYYNFNQYYYPGDMVYWNGSVYTCIVQNSRYYPDIKTHFFNGATYWGTGTPYQVPAGTFLTASTWSNSDFRSQEMVLNIVDQALYLIHKRIAPSNVPDVRVKAYDDAIQWLKDAAFGTITPNLLVNTPRSGGIIRMGGDKKQQNTY